MGMPPGRRELMRTEIGMSDAPSSLIVLSLGSFDRPSGRASSDEQRVKSELLERFATTHCDGQENYAWSG